MIEIGLTNSFQIVDKNNSIESNFEKCVGLFSDYQELKELIDWSLGHEKERIDNAKRMYRLCKEQYTYYNAMKIIIDDATKQYISKFVEMNNEEYD